MGHEPPSMNWPRPKPKFHSPPSPWPDTKKYDRAVTESIEKLQEDIKRTRKKYEEEKTKCPICGSKRWRNSDGTFDCLYCNGK